MATPTATLDSQVEERMRQRKFAPTPRQRALFAALDEAPSPGLVLVGYGGAMGGGKTRAIVELAIEAALAHANNNVLVARHNFTDLSTTTMREFFAACPRDRIRARRQAPTNLVKLAHPDWDDNDASTVHFRHLSAWTGLGSEQYGAVLIDEAGEVDESAALMLLTRLRHPAQTQRWFVAASNPWPGWFHQWFVLRELPEAALAAADGRVVFIPARVDDNPHLPANYADLQRALLPPDWVERFIEGRFDAFAGLIYPAFDPRIHCWNGPLPEFRRYVGGLDFGSQAADAHHTAGIVAGLTYPRHPTRDPADTLIRISEFEDRGPGVTQRLEEWQRQCERELGPIDWCADRSQSAWIDHQRHQGQRVFPSRGGPESVNWGIALVQRRLSAAPPASYYSHQLVHFPRRMRQYQWNQSRARQADPKPRKRDDDLLDADRYMHELVEHQPPPAPSQIEITTPRRGRPALLRG